MGNEDGARVRLLGVPVPAAIVARIGAERLGLLAEFLRFGVVGVVGFVVDATVLMLMIRLGLGPWLGRLVSFLCGASTTYTLNRLWTFRHRAGEAGAGQWARFVVLNMVGFAMNYGTYATLLVSFDVVAAWPVLGVAGGSLAGMVANFVLSRRFVFNAT